MIRRSRENMAAEAKTGFRCCWGKTSPGYTLVELMVVVAIISILATVAVPAYINHVNRGRQSEAIFALMHARLDQEIFWERNNRYAATIGSLESFGNDPTMAFFMTDNGYRINVVSANADGYRLQAAKPFSGTWDRIFLEITANTFDAQPEILHEGAVHFSIFKWLFE